MFILKRIKKKSEGFTPSKEDLKKKKKYPHLIAVTIAQLDGEANLLIGINNVESYRPLGIISEEYRPITCKQE